MTDRERTAGGALGRLAGKIKEAAGAAAGRDELAREGRLQQARVDAEREANRLELEAARARAAADAIDPEEKR